MCWRIDRKQTARLVAGLIAKGFDMDAIRKFLAGKKTYLTGCGAILAAVVAWAAGTIELGGLAVAIITALQTMWIRAGIAKSGS